MEDALDPEHGAWSLCDHCANAWHEEQMDSTPYASSRSVLRGRLRSSSVEPKREQRGRSPEGALEDREEAEHKRNEIYQQLLNLPEDGGSKADRLIRRAVGVDMWTVAHTKNRRPKQV